MSGDLEASRGNEGREGMGTEGTIPDPSKKKMVGV
jgi:hypothetical protein